MLYLLCLPHQNLLYWLLTRSPLSVTSRVPSADFARSRLDWSREPGCPWKRFFHTHSPGSGADSFPSYSARTSFRSRQHRARNILPCPVLSCQPALSARARTQRAGADQRRPASFLFFHRPLRIPSSSWPGEQELPLLLRLSRTARHPGCPLPHTCKPQSPTFQKSNRASSFAGASVLPTCLSRPSRSILALARAPPSVASPAHAAERGSSFLCRPPAAHPVSKCTSQCTHPPTHDTWELGAQANIPPQPPAQLPRIPSPRRHSMTKGDAIILWH